MIDQRPLLPASARPLIAQDLAYALDGGTLLIAANALTECVSPASIRTSLCTPTNWSRDTTGLPLALDLTQCDTLQRDLIGGILQREQDQRRYFPLEKPRIYAHLASGVSFDEVVRHLARQLIVLPVDTAGYRSGVISLWRFFDPRVFANLCWMLDHKQLDELLGPISTWTFPWFDHWFTLERSHSWEPDVDAESIAVPATPSHIDLGMWERTERIASINQVLVRLALPNDGTWEQRVSVATRTESALVAAARHLNWPSTEDQMRYAECILRYGEPFANHPKLESYRQSRQQSKAPGHWDDIGNLFTADDYAAWAACNAIAQSGVHQFVHTTPSFMRT